MAEAAFARKKDEFRVCTICHKPCRIMWTRYGNRFVQAIGTYFAPDPTAFTKFVTTEGLIKTGVKCSEQTPRAEYGYELHRGKNCISPNFLNE